MFNWLINNMRAGLCVNTLENAVKAYPGLRGAIVRRDRGSQYTGDEYRRAVSKYGIIQSMNSAGGRCHDNAKCESLWARFKEELLYGGYDTTKIDILGNCARVGLRTDFSSDKEILTRISEIFKEKLTRYGGKSTAKPPRYSFRGGLMTMAEVKSLIWRYFMSYWNNRRICSANGGLPPMVKRRRYYESLTKAA
jgi:transposase InsO family protein